MKFKKKQDGIIIMITSFNQLYNFISFFLKKNLIKGKKIYLIIFSDQIPDTLIFNLKKYIEHFVSVEVIDLRREFNISKFKFLQIKFLKKIYYYYLVFKKIFELKKNTNISYFVISGRMQFPVLCFMALFSYSKFFLIEDGVGNYVPRDNYQKKQLSWIFFEYFLKLNKSKVRILQLAEPGTKYHFILNQPFLKKEYLIDNRQNYIDLLKSFEKKLFFKPKCIIIATNPIQNTIDYYISLYTKTLTILNKKHLYKPDEILFFIHPRTNIAYRNQLDNSLSGYATIHPISSFIVENYLSEDNLELVIGSLSSALYYAKTIFKKNNVYHLDDNTSSHHEHFVKVFTSVGIKNFFNSDIYNEQN